MTSKLFQRNCDKSSSLAPCCPKKELNSLSSNAGDCASARTQRIVGGVSQVEK